MVKVCLWGVGWWWVTKPWWMINIFFCLFPFFWRGAGGWGMGGWGGGGVSSWIFLVLSNVLFFPSACFD